MEKKSSVAVLVPIYKTSFSKYEKFSFYHNAKILSNRDIFLLGPKRLENHLISLSKTINNGHVTIVEDRFFNNKLSGNSRLFLSYDLYNRYVDYEYILICHHDVFVFKDNLDFWISRKFDNIGAPLFLNKKADSSTLKKGNNGGFCLRKVDSCLKVLAETKFTYSRIEVLWKMEPVWYWKIFRVLRDGIIYNYKWKKFHPVIHEDMFWSVVVPNQFKWFKNAEFCDAKLFSFEEKPKLMFELTNNTLPMGMHAWWKFDKDAAMELIRNFDDKSEILTDESET